MANSIMFGNNTPPKKKELSPADRQLIIDAGENPDDYEYTEDYVQSTPTSLSESDRQLIIQAGENPDDYEYEAGYVPEVKTNQPWTRQEGDTVYYDDNTPVSISAVREEVPSAVRAEVAALSKPEDRLKALRKYYPDAQAIGTDQFIMRDTATGKPVVFNIESYIPSWGDVASAGPEIAGGLGAAIAGFGGSAAGPLGTIGGGAAGYTGGKQLYERGMNFLSGNEDTRTVGEQAADIGIDAATGLAAEVGGAVLAPVIRRGASAIGNALSPSRMFGGRVAADSATDAAARLAEWDALGIRPTPGMIGGRNAASKEQSLLTNNTKMNSRVGEVYDDVGQRFEDLIGQATGGRNPTAAEAGEAIQGRATDFQNAIKARQGELYDEAGRLTDGVPAVAPNTKNLIKSVKQEFGALGQSARMNTGAAFDGTIKQAEAILNDVSKGATFDTLKNARTSIGDIAFDRNLGTKESQLYRSLYKALTDDMTETAAKAGEDAIQAMRKANNYTARMKQPGNIISQNVSGEILKKQVPEAVYQLVQTTSAKAGSKLTQIMRQAKLTGGDDAVKDIGASVFNKLGRDNAGDFSPARLVSDWDKMPSETKKALFMTKDGNELRNSMENIVKVSRQLVDYSGGKNHSNTATHLFNKLSNITDVAAIGSAAFTMNPSHLLIPLVKGAGSAVQKNYQYKIFNSPETLKWMAGLNAGTRNGALNRLRVIGQRTGDETLKAAIRSYINDYESQYQ